MNYNQFCPIAKAAEILGERWTMLILREVLMGGRRFSELQRGLGDISPALLTSRLKTLEEQGLLARRKIGGQKGFEYFPTEACQALMPVLFAVGEWGIIWAQNTILDAGLDVDFLMLYMERSIDPTKLVGDETVIKFRFNDLTEQRDWWVIVEGDGKEICLKDPGRDVNVYFDCAVTTLRDVWMGDRSYKDAIESGDLKIQGDPALTRSIRNWLKPSVFADSPREAVAAA
ncbi:MAG: winged helix-turn-helix transcriptional regulator [Flavobacteriaceae bacterium]